MDRYFFLLSELHTSNMERQKDHLMWYHCRLIKVDYVQSSPVARFSGAGALKVVPHLITIYTFMHQNTNGREVKLHLHDNEHTRYNYVNAA